MKFLRQGIALTVLGAGLAATPGLAAQAAPPAPTVDSRSLVQQMKDEATGSVTFSKEDATGKVGFVRAGTNGDLLADTGGTAVSKADAYLDRFAAAFGATPGQLKREDKVLRANGGSTVTYTQEYKGVPVFGSMLRAHVDKDGDLTSVNGFAVPGLDLSVTPRLSATEAAQRAIAVVKAAPPGHDGVAGDTAGIKAGTNDLVVYRTGSTAGQANGTDKLVYVVEVTNGKNIRDMVFVDADADKIVNRYSMVHDALDRELYEADSERNLTRVWKEGDPFPGTLNQEQQNLVNGTGESYWFFKDVFGRDSYDANGATMRTINNDPAIACPNANWNGQTTNYCNGVTSDDVVSHEWGHAYTEYTHGLIYQYQPGALNESYSDIWGETIDLINGRLDEGEGDLSAKRPDGQCSKYTRGGISATINSPAAIAGPCAAAAAASFGPVFDKTGVTSDVVVGQDAANPDGPSTTDGCSPFTNAGALAGTFAYVDRGTCTFATKVANAEDAGASGIVVGDSVAGRAPISMSGDADIYGLMVTKGDGDKIKAATSTVNMTVKDSDTDPKADSYRWLMGEKSHAFGGAIRDMWTPTCYGDPGKVSDAEYFCGTEDGGGVHSNSGVSNHAYALAVDGGTYNGVTVPGIGLEKAAAVYYKAMTEYQTPTTDFEDHANALDAACTALIGQPVKKLTVEPNAAPANAGTIETTDCATIAAVSNAVEFRKAPTQCNYQPMHNQNRPALCDGKGRGVYTVYKQAFEKGIPADWDADQETVYAGATGSPWVATTDAPTGNGPAHPGGVAYGPAPDQGQCDGTANDFSSRDGLISKIIQLPDQKLKAPKLSFDHYVATELGFDGGNVKYRINGGAFKVIPAAAYTNNGPRTLSTEAEGSTNPLAGQPGFTGTDGGEVAGSWAQSQVDLSMLGVAGGDEIEFRFDIGRDGCGGIDGWYIDNVAVTICKIRTTVEAIHAPQPSRYGTASKVKVTVKPAATGTVAGTVRLINAQGHAIDTARLVRGKATFTLSKKLAVGSRVFTVRYVGNATYLAGSDKVKVTVRRR
ncbi:M4 family metallopeptidase [Nocardioides guangzhouensis]|uniref:M4 family metallopeptidase n=1 Tax=Nocardioides guangzhouensis TaxID=2497878 RepID=UPI0014385175|nr:M4 family metallopeptidase [Nocardioides guangzhouensis]